jgi:hypothetical protein
MWGSLSDKTTDLSFTTVTGPRQRSHCEALIPRNLWPYFAVSGSGLPRPGGPGPHIYEYILQEQGGPVTSPGTGFPFRPLLRLAGLQ